MKIAKLILLGSLIVNVTLALTYLSNNHGVSTATAVSTSAPKPHDSTASEKWNLIAKATAGDDAAFVARLRAEGFPPAVVRAIVSTQIAERFSAQRRALQDATGEYAYWKGWSSINSSNPEARAALRKLYREQSDLLRQLLGD